VHFGPDEIARLDYAASYAAQGPGGHGDPRLVRRLERWLQRNAPVRARLDAATLRNLLALVPLYGAYREHRRETIPLYHRAVTPPDDAAAALEARLRAALARLEDEVVPLPKSNDQCGRPRRLRSPTAPSGDLRGG
jgi:hypothetical protein